MQKFIANHLYKRSFISYLLLPLAMINFIIQKTRRYIPRKQFISKAKIISVGNITSGGSGKTPTTIFLSKLLQAKGKKVAISHRGYKGKFEQKPTLISDENKIYDFAPEAGDEAFYLPQNCLEFLLWSDVKGKKQFPYWKKNIRKLNILSWMIHSNI